MLTGMTVNSEDEYATMLECDKDNQITFDRNGTYVIDEGPQKCMSSTPQTTSGTWSLEEVRGQSLTLTEEGVSQTTTIVELTPTTMVLRYDDDSGSSTSTIILTYSHPRQ
jgi:hypothetical protein